MEITQQRKRGHSLSATRQKKAPLLCRKTPRQRSRAEEKQESGLVLRYSLLPLAMLTCSEAGLDVHALIKEFTHRTGRAQVGDTLQRVPASARENGISTYVLGGDTLFISKQALSFRTRHHLCRQGLALAGTQQLRSIDTVPLHVHCTEGITRSEGLEGARGGGNGIRVGNGDGDGHGAGSGAKTETRMEREVGGGR